MLRSQDGILRALSGPLAAVLLLLSVAVPVLERADLATGLVIESEHDPGSCPTPHDHTVCTQVGANHATTTSSLLAIPASFIRRAPGVQGAERLPRRARSFDAPARAPPSV